jgi:hypothetical protein
MIRKSGYRFSEKIMLKGKTSARLQSGNLATFNLKNV